MLAAKLLAAGGGAETLYADDVFSAYTYTGNGSTQTITNGIDLSGKGGLVWLKDRTSTGGHSLFDTTRGVYKALGTHLTNAQLNWTPNGLTAFNSNGFSIAGADGDHNLSPRNYVSWTFRKAPKFFDVVTFTATASTNQRISHSLGQSPGMIIAKRTDNTSQWEVYHRSIGRDSYIWLNDTGAAGSYAGRWGTSDPTSTDFGINGTSVFGAGTSWVAYLFAHDTGTDGLIQCGSFTTDGSGNATVTLGWEPQFGMVKAVSGGAPTGNWTIADAARGNSTLSIGVSNQQLLWANDPRAEYSSYGYLHPTATGLSCNLSPSTTYIYLAIRRPNKPPTTGTQVYNAIARTGTGAAATVTGVGFAPDLLISPIRNNGNYLNPFTDRLRGAGKLFGSARTDAEITDATTVTAFGMDGVSLGADSGGYTAVNQNTCTYINWFFKRAPGVFDVVCGESGNATVARSHNLGVKPEMIIGKYRDLASQWDVYCDKLNGGVNPEDYYLEVSGTSGAKSSADVWGATGPTSAYFYKSVVAPYKGVFYLFATLAGVSKVGSYTGTATTNAINCGFTTGARFVMIKRTDSTGDWYVWDTTRGIIAGNDPYLLLNSTAAEVTGTDYIDPSTSGFELSSTAPAAINASGGTFIYLAFA